MLPYGFLAEPLTSFELPIISGTPYRKASRKIAASYLGRPLLSREEVHHVDGNVLNNKIENLIIFESASAHQAHHNRLRLDYLGYPTKSDWGIVLYGPAYKKRRIARNKYYCERMKRDLGLI